MIKTIIFKDIKDFRPDHIFECGQCFRWNLEDDRYVGIVNGYVARISWDAASSVLELEVTGGDEEFWSHYLDLNTDYTAIKEAIISREPEIARACEYGSGIRILNQDMFETLISFIISQNNNIPRIKKCIEAICENYGEPLGEMFGKARYSFPSAEALAGAQVSAFAELKLGYRCEYIVASAIKYLEEGKPQSYEELLKYLGVGPKVANCIVLFGLHKVDAFPIDTWVKHIMNDMYGFEENDVKAMARFAAEKFGNYAGYAQQYLFYYYRDRS